MKKCEVEDRFWRLFSRTMNQSMSPGTYSVNELKSWNSLKHVELVFELEESFDLNIKPEDVVAMYSNTENILSYLSEQLGCSE